MTNESEPLAVTVNADPATESIIVGWELRDPGVLGASDGGRPPTVVGYDVAFGGDGLFFPQPHEGTGTTTRLPWGIVAQSVAIGVTLRVSIRLDDGTTVGPWDTHFEVPPRYEVAPTRHWEPGPARTIVDNDTRLAAGPRVRQSDGIGFAEVHRAGEPSRPGLSYWPDGNIGFAPHGSAVHGYAPGTRWRVNERRGPWVEEVDPCVTISGLREPADYIGGGPVHHYGDGHLLLVYHGEVFASPENPMVFWGFLGLARSTDGGRTFEDLGRIVTPNAGMNPRFPVEIGGGPFVIVDGHFHLYFRETVDGGPQLNLSVARAPVADVLRAAEDGQNVPWFKYRSGAWREPGLGGLADELLADSPVPRWFDVVELADHGLFVLVHSDGLLRSWTAVVRTSPDGLNWSAAERLFPPEHEAELLYLTLSSPDLTSQRVVHGDRVDLYRVRSARTGSHRWEDAVLERVQLRYRGISRDMAPRRSEPGRLTLAATRGARRLIRGARRRAARARDARRRDA